MFAFQRINEGMRRRFRKLDRKLDCQRGQENKLHGWIACPPPACPPPAWTPSMCPPPAYPPPAYPPPACPTYSPAYFHMSAQRPVYPLPHGSTHMSCTPTSAYVQSHLCDGTYTYCHFC